MRGKFVDVSASILVDVAVGVDGQGAIRIYRDDNAPDVRLHRNKAVHTHS